MKRHFVNLAGRFIGSTTVSFWVYHYTDLLPATVGRCPFTDPTGLADDSSPPAWAVGRSSRFQPRGWPLSAGRLALTAWSCFSTRKWWPGACGFWIDRVAVRHSPG